MTVAELRGRAERAVTGERRVDLVLRLSLLALIFNSREHVVTLLGAAVLAVVALRSPARFRNPWLWLGAFAVLLVRNAAAWEGLDNHVVLTMWWVLAIGLALRSPDPATALATNGRLLVGLTFAFATVWKVVSGEFLSGDFFHHSLLLDDRFRYLAESIGGLSAEAYRANHELVGGLRGVAGEAGAALATTGRIEAMALAVTWWTVLIEAAVAVTWLAGRRALATARHASLLMFAFTTYLAVPVGGFGALLMVMALAQCGHAPRARLHWVAAFAFLLLWAPVWRALFY